LGKRLVGGNDGALFFVAPVEQFKRYTHGGRSRTEYVSRDFVPDVQRQVGNYKRFKALTAEWIDFED
jgi:hypothetical protein